MFKSTYLKGVFAEFYVIILLKFKGYKILRWRMRNYVSEIDIIAKKGNAITAIEVKYRPHFEDGLYAISLEQQKNIRKAFELYIAHYKGMYDTLRCDVCIVTKWGRVRHLKGMF